MDDLATCFDQVLADAVRGLRQQVAELRRDVEVIRLVVSDDAGTFFEDWGGLPPVVIDLLVDAGYETPDVVRSASDDDLLAVDGIGPFRLAQIRKALGAQNA